MGGGGIGRWTAEVEGWEDAVAVVADLSRAEVAAASIFQGA